MRYKFWPPEEGKEVPVSFLGFEVKERTIWISDLPIPEDEFPPCIKSILGSVDDRGKNRAAAVLAAFLGQAGWEREDAFRLWDGYASKVALKNGEALFSKWFGTMHCPSCRTIQSQSPGYPRLGLDGLGHCLPDRNCSSWPLGYGNPNRQGHEKSLGRSLVVRLYVWDTGREEEVEIKEAEKDALLALLEIEEGGQLLFSRCRVKGALRPVFSLKQNDEPRRHLLSEML